MAKGIAIPNTAGWQTWENLTVPNISLSAGTQVVRITIGATDFVNLNYMTFAPAATAPAASIQLKAGWNLVGYPLAGSAAIDVALASVWANVLSVKTYDLFYDKSSTPALNTLKTIQWGEGYWVKVDKASMLTWK